MERKPIIVLLAGPTASGKSKLAIKLSKVLNGEIVNADSMQVYKELKILFLKVITKDQLGRMRLINLPKNLYMIGLKILNQHLIQIFFINFLFILPKIYYCSK